MSENTARDALLAEVLGELYTLRDEVAHLMTVVPDARSAIEKGGELATLKFAAQADKTVAVLDARITLMSNAVKDVGAMREMLVGAITTQAIREARAQLLDAVREITAQRRTDGVHQYIGRILSGVGGAVIGGALVAAANVALRLP
jgi:hypothetical protein